MNTTFPKLDKSLFTPEQAEAIEKYTGEVIHYLVETIDGWMYNQVLPKIINVDDEPYGGAGIISRAKITAQTES